MKIVKYTHKENGFISSEWIHSFNYVGEFHTHPFYELGLVLGGSGTYETARQNIVRRIPVRENNLIFWDGKLPHRVVDTPGTPLHQIIAVFDHAYIKSMAISKNIRAIFKDAQPLIVDDPLAIYHIKFLLRKIMAEQRAGMVGGADIVLTMATQILVEIYRNLKPTHASCRQMDPRIRFIINDVRVSYNQPHSLNEYAEYLALTSRRLTTLFRASTGKTFVQHLHELRIERAKEMLEQGALKIAAIAFEAGFENLSHFNRIFKSIVGCAPIAYRKYRRP